MSGGRPAPQPRRRPAAGAAALLLAAAAATTCLLGGTRAAPAFALGRRILAAPRVQAVTRYAEAEVETQMEAPPADSELTTAGGTDPLPNRKRIPKRFIRGTLRFDRRNLNEEAERLRPYTEPLLEKQLSVKEITFVLNRQGSKLRHLLYRPRLGLPIFTEHKVRRLLRRAKSADMTRLNKFARPPHLPANSPGARYPEPLKDVYAEVPPLKPWSPKGGAKK